MISLFERPRDDLLIRQSVYMVSIVTCEHHLHHLHSQPVHNLPAPQRSIKCSPQAPPLLSNKLQDAGIVWPKHHLVQVNTSICTRLCAKTCYPPKQQHDVRIAAPVVAFC